jgi:ABC-type glycerol-3-phosphate transport system permease component
MPINKLNEQKSRESRFKFGESLLGFHSWVIYIFLYLPIIVLIVFSFSKSRGSSLSESLFTLNLNEYQTSLDSGIISEKLKKEFIARQYPLSKYATTSAQKIGRKWRISDKVIFDIDNASQTEWALNHKTVTEPLRQQFMSYGSPLSYNLTVSVKEADKQWLLKDNKHTYTISKNDKKLNVLTDKNIVYSVRKVRDEIRVSLWYGFSLDWYKKLFTDREIFGPTKNSLIVAVISTIISTILGK